MSSKMSSFFGKMLVVDLTSGRIEDRSLPREWVDLYTGQKGLGSRILMEDFDVETDPLSPDNRIILTTGIMTGTIVSCSAKLAMTTKSPQTGTISDGSVGGHIGAELKYAGYDAVLITGKAPELSYLHIDPDTKEICTIPEFRGMGTFDTEDKLKELTGDEKLKVLAIGPAGENLVPFSCVSSERYRQLGRGGMGAVMGSKNLKAISIRGWLDVSVADIRKCMEISMAAHIKDGVIDPENEIYTLGTSCLIDYSQESGLLPTENFSKGMFPDYQKINGDAFKAVRLNKKACFSCGIACGNYVKDGDAVVEGPEYETIALCGTSIGVSSRADIIRMNALCDDLGLDTISSGGIIAYMMEATEKGLHDFGIRFGEAEKALSYMEDMAFRRDIGEESSRGSKWLAEKYGGTEYAMQVKGMELPGYDPRGSWGMGVAYASAPRGGCHMSAYPLAEEAWGTLDPFTFEGKGKLVADMQNSQFVKFSMGVCDFWSIDDKTIGSLYEATAGGEWPEEKVYAVGERIFNLQRMFNVMLGFERREDTLPGRLFKEILKEGPPKDHPMTKVAFDKAMSEYYSYRGWDERGRPTIEKLKELGIEDKLIEAYADKIGIKEEYIK